MLNILLTRLLNDTQTELMYISVLAFAIVLAMLIMSIIAYKNISLNKYQRARIVGIFLTIAVICLADFGSSLIELTKATHLKWLDYTFTFWSFCSVPYIPIGLINLLHSDKKKLSLTFKIAFIVFHIYVLILLILTICGQVFVINDDMQYEAKLPGLIFYIISYIGSVLFLLIDSLILFKKLLAKKTITIFVLFFVLLASTSLQILLRNVRFTYLIISIIAIIFYDYVASIYAQIDGLTGLFSQYAFIRYSPSIKKGQGFIVLDVDDFKSINDNYGHIKGDAILVDVAKCIQLTFGKIGKGFRTGGDEFIVVTKKEVDYEAYIEIFKENIKAIRSNNDIFPQVSVGYSIYDGKKSFKEYESLADQNMYLDKARNKKVVVEERKSE